MSRDNIFSKHLPNIKLDTLFDADGKEIQVIKFYKFYHVKLNNRFRVGRDP